MMTQAYLINDNARLALVDEYPQAAIDAGLDVHCVEVVRYRDMVGISNQPYRGTYTIDADGFITPA